MHPQGGPFECRSREPKYLMSALGPLRHFAATRRFGCFSREAVIQRAAPQTRRFALTPGKVADVVMSPLPNARDRRA